MLARSSSCGSNPADVGPHLKGTPPCRSILACRDMVAAEMKEVVDLVVGGEETLCLPGRLEPLHLSLSPSGRLVRILCPVVQPFMLPMLDARDDLPLCRTLARQLVGDHDARRPALPLQQLAEQALGGALIAPALDQHVEHNAVLVYRTPQPVLLAGDFDGDLVQVPFVSGTEQPPADPVGEVLAELERPLPPALVAHDDAARGQHLLDHAQAEREAEVQPYRLADHLRWETVAGIG